MSSLFCATNQSVIRYRVPLSQDSISGRKTVLRESRDFSGKQCFSGENFLFFAVNKHKGIKKSTPEIVRLYKNVNFKQFLQIS